VMPRDPQTLVAGIAEAAGDVPLHYLELYHADDRSAGAAIDSCIKAGEWLLLHTVEEGMSGLDVLLRYIGRRLFTIMPNKVKRSRVEDFRLFLCIPRRTAQSAVFRKLAFRLTYEMILPALKQLDQDDLNSPLNSPLDTISRPGTTSYYSPTSRRSISIGTTDTGVSASGGGGGLLRSMLTSQKLDALGINTAVDGSVELDRPLAGATAGGLPERQAADCPVGAIFFRSGVRSKTPLEVRRATSARQRRPASPPKPHPQPDRAAPVPDLQAGASVEEYESKASDAAQALYLALLRRFHRSGPTSADDALLQVDAFIGSLSTEQMPHM
jgi:hypothetical protein